MASRRTKARDAALEDAAITPREKAILLWACLMGGALWLYGTLDTSVLSRSIDALTDPRAAAELGERYFSPLSYDRKKAEHYYTQAFVGGYTTVEVRYQLGRLAFLDGRFEEALAHFNAVLAGDEIFPKAYYMRGLTYGYMQRFEEAAQDFYAYLQHDSLNWAAYNDLAWVYFTAGSYKASYDVAFIGLGYADGNPWLLNSLGVASLALGDYAAAADAFALAEQTLDKMDAHDWGRAYPGNDPAIHEHGLASMKEAVRFNAELARTKKTITKHSTITR